MTAREPFAKLVLERDRSYFIYAEGELLDFTTSQDSAEERCERLNLAFEKAVAKRSEKVITMGVWVVESFENGEWIPIEAYIDAIDAFDSVCSLKKQADDPSTWRRRKYVRDTTT